MHFKKSECIYIQLYVIEFDVVGVYHICTSSSSLSNKRTIVKWKINIIDNSNIYVTNTRILRIGTVSIIDFTIYSIGFLFAYLNEFCGFFKYKKKHEVKHKPSLITDTFRSTQYLLVLCKIM